MEIEAQFREQGFFGPVRVLSAQTCARLVRAFLNDSPPPLDWNKGLGPVYRPVYAVATRSAVIDVVRRLLGEDVMLWGAQFITRDPQSTHAFHSDLETAGHGEKTVSVWIGLRNVSSRSSLQVIPSSHRYGEVLQEALANADADHGSVVALARRIDPNAVIHVPDMSDGDAIFFDGRLWHGTENRRTRGSRMTLLLQYAAAGTSIRIPNLADRSLPLKFFDDPKPSCIMVNGSAPSNANRFVAGPSEPETGLPVMTTWIRDLKLPLSVEKGASWTTYPQTKGATASLRSLRCHASALASGATPHVPHDHQDEEILVVLGGRLEILNERQDVVKQVPAGSGIYYPAGFKHTVRNPGPDTASYVMFKWTTDRAAEQGEQSSGSAPAGLKSFDLETDPVQTSNGNVHRVKLVDCNTGFLSRLKLHQTFLPVGQGYEPHVDAYDVALITFGGVSETLGQRVGPGHVVFYAAGEPHGLKAVGDEPSNYLVIEFRAVDQEVRSEQATGSPALLRRLRRRVGLFLRDYPRLRAMLRR